MDLCGAYEIHYTEGYFIALHRIINAAAGLTYLESLIEIKGHESFDASKNFIDADLKKLSEKKFLNAFEVECRSFESIVRPIILSCWYTATILYWVNGCIKERET